MSFGENEHAMIPDMAEAALELMEVAGGRNIQPFTVPDRQPGYGMHEVGVVRMGHNPWKFVLNQLQQCHAMPNLLVLDGSGFTSSACQNPTLTIMALCVRSCDHLMQEMKHGNV
jgi:glucoside 3-dehydrogenase (cytochrome c) catalytic subunit